MNQPHGRNGSENDGKVQLNQIHGFQDKAKIKLLHLNVCSLTSKLNLGLLNEYVESFDIVCFSETKTDEADEKNISLQGFLPKYKHRKYCNNKSGGLVTFFKDYLYGYITELNHPHSEIAQWFKIDKAFSGYDFILCNTYIPPSNTKYYSGEEFTDLLENIIFVHSEHDCDLCIVGDFNAKTANLNDYITLDSTVAQITGLDHCEDSLFIDIQTFLDLNIPMERYNQDKRCCDKSGHDLLDLCKSAGLLIVNGRTGSDQGIGNFTCEKMTSNGISKSTNDYILASPRLFSHISNFEVDIFDPLMSDCHCPLILELDRIDVINVNNKITNKNPSDTVKIDKYRNQWEDYKKSEFIKAFNMDSISEIKNDINHIIENSESIDKSNIDTLMTRICNIYQEAGKQSGVIKLIKPHNKFRGYKRKTPKRPWFHRDCAIKRKEFFKSKRKFKNFKSVENEKVYKAKGKEFKLATVKARREYNSVVHKTLRNLKSKCPKDYWNILNKTDQGKEKLGEIMISEFFNHFKKLNEHRHENQTLINTDESEIIDDSPINVNFTEAELLEHTKVLKNSKSCGIDSIINEFLKYCPSEMIELLTNFFNLILNTGVIPSDWAKGIIVPIFKKKGDINDPDNYRGITLLSCLGKLFTLLLNTRLTKFLESNNLLGEEQVGFRFKYSTLDHIFTLHSLLDLYLFNKKRLYCAFVDYRKAFDSVDRVSLWQKLIDIGIKGKVFNIIKNLYNDAKSCVRYQGQISDYFNCNMGVRQGENLSPLLFSIFLNDLETFLKGKNEGIQIEFTLDGLDCYIKLFVLLYADDTILLSESADELQNMLNSLNDYCNRWKLEVNISKTKIIVFSRGLVKKYPKFTFANQDIEVVKDYVYLGVTFNFNNKFNKAINKQLTQAKRALFSIVAKSRRLCLPIDIQLHLFDTCIMPILLYGCEIWGFSNIKDIEIFHNQFCKRILNVGKNTINNMVLGELGRFKIEKQVKSRMLNFWARLISSKNTKICIALYHKMKELFDSNEHKSNWMSYIYDTLEELELTHLWNENPENIRPHILKHEFDKKLNLYYTNKWHRELENSHVYESYEIFKTTLEMEKYLLNIDPKYAIPLCRFRTLNHKLPIVTGRFNETRKIDRLCTKCNSEDIGDEFHYLFRCEFFKSERKLLIDDYYTICPNTLKMKKLFNCIETKTLINLSKFVKIIMDSFK